MKSIDVPLVDATDVPAEIIELQLGADPAPALVKTCPLVP